MNKIVLPEEVYKLVKDEVSSYKDFTAGYILNNYKLGVSDLILRFNKDGEVAVLKNEHLINDRDLIDVRTRLLAVIYKEIHSKYYDLFKDLDVVMPVCVSDTTDYMDKFKQFSFLQEIPCLLFCKTAYSNNILMPSVNNFAGYQEIDFIGLHDTPLSKKQNKMCCVGSFTGNLSVDSIKENPRYQLLMKFKDSPDSIFLKLLRPPKMDSESFQDVVDRCNVDENLLVNSEEKVDLIEQLKYKFQICMDGHVSAWARLPWQMKSNSVPIKIRNRKDSWKEWFYPLLNPSKHFIECDIDQVGEVYEFLCNNHQFCEDINENGKSFVDKYCNKDLALDIFAQTLLLLNDKQNNSFLGQS